MKPITHLLLLMSIASLSMACNTKQDNKSTESPIVKTCRVEQTDRTRQQDFAFISKPYRASELSFRIGGPIDKFEVYSGNSYKQGEVIAQIDPRDFMIRKNRAEALYEQAKAEADRIAVLFRQDNISASAHEKAKADCTAAKMAYETALNELSDTKLIAPFNGYIGAVYIERYQDVKATQPVVSLVDISRLKIEAYVPQQIAFDSKRNQKINLRFDADPERVYTATIEEISKSTTANNLSYLLTALLPNSDAKLLAGMSGKLYFEAQNEKVESVLTIPQAALSYRPSQGNYVWVVDPATGQVQQRNVSIGEMLGGQVEVRSGLSVGEVVVTSGLRFLSDGDVVSVALPKA